MVSPTGVRRRARNAAGNSVTSATARLTVAAAAPHPLQPYIGVNVVGVAQDTAGYANQGAGSGGVLTPIDVAGVVPQENFNKLTDTNLLGAPLWDSARLSTPVTITYWVDGSVIDGAGDMDADHALFQGYIHNDNTNMTVTLNGLPPAAVYDLFLYSLGFNFNTTYEEAVDLIGAQTYTTFHVRAQDVSQYLPSPGYVKMATTDPNARHSCPIV